MHMGWQAFVGLLLLLCACGRVGESGKPVIAVSFDSQKWLVEQIVGEDYEVVALLPSGSDPEMFDPDMRTMRALERADVYFTTSTLGFETQVSERIKANYPSLKVVDLTSGIDILMHTHGIAGASKHGISEDDHDHHHSHESHPVGDPHLLSSIVNAGQVADNIYQAVTDLQSEENGSVSNEKLEKYKQNLTLLQERLNSIYHTTDSLLRASGALGATFVVMHPSLSYYARDFGMTQIPLETDGKEASPRQLEERLAFAASSNPRALFFENGHSERQAHELAKSLGIEAYGVMLNGSDFLEGIEEVTRNLTKKH